MTLNSKIYCVQNITDNQRNAPAFCLCHFEWIRARVEFTLQKREKHIWSFHCVKLPYKSSRTLEVVWSPGLPNQPNHICEDFHGNTPPSGFKSWTKVSSAVQVSYLKELNSYTGEHEVQQHGDQHNVPNGFNGHKHTLYHVLRDRTQDSALISSSQLIRGFAGGVSPIETDCRRVLELTFSPLALFIARKGRRTLSTRRIFTTEIALDLRRQQRKKVFL